MHCSREYKLKFEINFAYLHKLALHAAAFARLSLKARSLRSNILWTLLRNLSEQIALKEHRKMSSNSKFGCEMLWNAENNYNLTKFANFCIYLHYMHARGTIFRA
jgi:hypothetical protein